MVQRNPVSRQKKIVVLACIDSQTKTAVDAICDHYKTTADDVLLVPRKPGEITILSALLYYKRHTHFFSTQGYTGFVLIGRDKKRNLSHETEELKESFPHLAFDAWRLHIYSGDSTAGKIS